MFSLLFPLPMLCGRSDKDIEILFVGAEGKMEMEKVPAAGYQTCGTSGCGDQRKIF